MKQEQERNYFEDEKDLVLPPKLNADSDNSSSQNKA